MTNRRPIACDLSAIEDDELEEHKKNSRIFESVQEALELDEGYAFRLPTETEIIEKAGAFVSRERLCCPFFHFELEVKPDHGPVYLKVKGDERVKQFVKENIVAQLEQDNGDGWNEAKTTVN
jgi:hypothetical protein